MSTRKKPSVPADVMASLSRAGGTEAKALPAPPTPKIELPAPVVLPVESPQPAAPPVQAFDIGAVMNEAMAAHGSGDLPRAEQLYRAVLEANWAEPEILRRVGEVCLSQGRHSEALPNLLKSVALAAHDARANAQAGVCCSFLGRLSEARRYYDRAVSISPNFPLALWNRSLHKLYNGEYEEGWDEYRWGTLLGVRPNRHIEPQWAPQVRTRENYTPHLREYAPYGDKTLYVWAEQGFGDALMFLRFTKGLKARYGFSRIVLEVQAPLLPLLWDYDREDIDLIVGAQIDGGFTEPFDEHISLVELPRVLGVNRVESLPSAPYLTAPTHPQAAAVLAAWRTQRKSEGKLLVGVVWKGNPGHVNDKARSVDLARFEELSKVAGVQLIPLIPGEKPAFCPEAFDLADFGKTAQVIGALDLIISVDTSVVHLAGALGKPCWTLIPKACDWRWYMAPGDPEKAVWYDSLRLFRQDVQGEWDGVFAKVKGALEALVYKETGTLPRDIPMLGPGDPAWLPSEVMP